MSFQSAAEESAVASPRPGATPPRLTTFADPLSDIEIRLATPADNEALLALTRLTPMAGKIALRIDREPDFFALLRARGDAFAYVATHCGEVIGCMSAATYPAYIDGALETVAHAGDLKVHPQFTGRRIALHLATALETHLRNLGIDLSFSLIADGNHRALALCDGKHGTPIQVMLGRFIVSEILPSPFRKRSRRYTLSKATPADLPALTTLLDDFARARSFARPTNLPDLAARLSDPSTTTLVARENSPSLATLPVATLTIADTSHLRRNVPIAFPAAIRFALPLLRLLFLPIRGIRIPRLGEPMHMLYIRFLTCTPGHESALKLLIAEARAIAFARRVTFLSIGLHERDPLRAAVAGLPAFTFVSRAMATSAISRNRVSTLTDTIPHEDFALI